MIIGIDPGISGAIAFLRPSDMKLHLYDTPIKVRNTKGNMGVDSHAVSRLIERYIPSSHTQVFAVVEQVSAMTYVDKEGNLRGQGAAASFHFGKSYGTILGILAALRVFAVLTPPAVWKTALGLSRDKEASLIKARYLFPQRLEKFARKKDDGRAEAALLAYFGIRLMKERA